MAVSDWILRGDASQTLLGIVIVLLTILLIKRLLEDIRAPPGPWGLPIVGYQPFLHQQNLPRTLKKLSEKYGKVFSLRLGQKLTVVLSDFESVKETLIQKSEIFAGRPDGFTPEGLVFDFKSVFNSEGEEFKEQRKFLVSALKDLGLAKLSMEGIIHDEVQAVKDFLIETNGQPQDLSKLMRKIPGNVISHFTFGQRFDFNNKKFLRMLKLVDELQTALNCIAYTGTLPLLRFLKSWTGLDKLLELKCDFEKCIDEEIKEHEETFDQNSLRDLTDIYLLKIQEATRNSNKKRSIFTRSHMLMNLMLLFMAGTDTIALGLLWALKLLLLHPNIQKKIQKELDAAIGRERLPSWADRQNLPYLEATTLELLRYANIVSVSLFHTNIVETELNGYTIPKRSLCLINFWQIHNDPKLWKNPEEFNPSRFLDKSGKVVKPDYLLPFSAGARFCLGASLARMEILITLGTILQCFDLLPPEGEEIAAPSQTAVVNSPGDFKVRCVIRK